jgi:hypothetical protein
MPESDRTPKPLPSAEQVLAAIDRAERHRRSHERPGAWVSDVKEHLGLPHTGATTVWLRPVWQQLEAERLIEQNRKGGLHRYQLTRTGKLRLAATQAELGHACELPESPQHARWRTAHDGAAGRIAGFRRDLRELLDEATALLEAGGQPPSGEWYEFGTRLGDACARLGSATHCLYEWAEPDDTTADVDDAPHGQTGRRDPTRWDRDETVC